MCNNHKMIYQACLFYPEKYKKCVDNSFMYNDMLCKLKETKLQITQFLRSFEDIKTQGKLVNRNLDFVAQGKCL